jgi:hypothetical protein
MACAVTPAKTSARCRRRSRNAHTESACPQRHRDTPFDSSAQLRRSCLEILRQQSTAREGFDGYRGCGRFHRAPAWAGCGSWLAASTMTFLPILPATVRGEPSAIPLVAHPHPIPSVVSLSNHGRYRRRPSILRQAQDERPCSRPELLECPVGIDNNSSKIWVIRLIQLPFASGRTSSAANSCNFACPSTTTSPRPFRTPASVCALVPLPPFTLRVALRRLTGKPIAAPVWIPDTLCIVPRVWLARTSAPRSTMPISLNSCAAI